MLLSCSSPSQTTEPRASLWTQGRTACRHTLTFTLDDVQVELLDGPHADLLQLAVHQHLQQRGGQVLAGRHAGGLGHLPLGGGAAGSREERDKEQGV